MLTLAVLGGAGVQLSAQQHAGKPVYDKWCAGCHGDTGAGDGEGAAYMLPRPRDFTRGIYQVRTTASGELPTRADLLAVVDEGMPGTAMPGWRERLTEREREDVVSYLMTFSKFFDGDAPEAIVVGGAPGESPEGIAEGQEVYRKLECFKCHGEFGRGDGTSAPTLTDDWDHPIRAADLTEHWTFNGGATVEQIYTRLRTGLDGTPMPSFTDAMESGVVTDEQLWRVAQYVRSLSPEERPEPREVVRAVLRPEGVPAGPEDSLWAGAERFYVPLVGQIIVEPRWFAPTVDGIWVQAIHDGRSLALRLAWHDPSRSPAPAWDEWLGRVRQTAFEADGTPPEAQGPDLLMVQFPRQATDEGERPYFLGGTAKRPVYLWRWQSAPERLVEGAGAGLGEFTVYDGGTPPAHVARYAAGEWQLQITRDLVPADTGAAPAFMPGRAVPVAFLAADGSNGEGDVRAAVSTWYAIYLDVPTPARVYVQPIVAVLLTGLVGAFVVYRAQARERDADRPLPEEVP